MREGDTGEDHTPHTAHSMRTCVHACVRACVRCLLRISLTFVAQRVCSSLFRMGTRGSEGEVDAPGGLHNHIIYQTVQY